MICGTLMRAKSLFDVRIILRENIGKVQGHVSCQEYQKKCIKITTHQIRELLK